MENDYNDKVSRVLSLYPVSYTHLDVYKRQALAIRHVVNVINIIRLLER